jgi:hypothetical protein
LIYDEASNAVLMLAYFVLSKNKVTCQQGKTQCHVVLQ